MIRLWFPRNIGQVTDVRAAKENDDSYMELELRFDSDDPPCGSVHRKRPDAEDDDRVAFTGWLGLLAALTELIRPAKEPLRPAAEGRAHVSSSSTDHAHGEAA